jgi:predicted Zn-dependent peptidase
MNKQTLRHTLSNGLVILGEPSARAQSCGIGFFVKTGARDETTKEAGVSHFLEHMVFKGTARRSALDITYQLGNIGAQANAYTSEETTVYYSSVIPEHFMEIHEILSDMMRPSLTQEEFDTEKNVILEEIALYEDRPQFYLFEHALADYFGEHPAGKSVLGTTESISALTRDEMADYFRRRYSAQQMTLVATGNFEWERFVEQSERWCGAWEGFEATRKTSPYRTTARYQEFQKKNVSQAHVLLMTEGCSAQDDDRYPMALLSSMLGDGSGSKFYWELVDTGIAESAMTDSDERDGTGCFMAYAVCEPPRADEVSDIMRRILSAPLEFSAEDLERAKTKLLTKIVLNGELPMGRLMALGTSWTARGEISDLEAVMARVKQVTRADIEETLAKYPLADWCEYRLVGA